jgi:hypothetical protein
VVLPWRLRWFNHGDSGGSTPETLVPLGISGPYGKIYFNNLFENLFYHIMREYYALCILQIHEMCIFEVVSHSVDIINYLASMWHVFSNKFQFAKLFYSSCFGSYL